MKRKLIFSFVVILLFCVLSIIIMMSKNDIEDTPVSMSSSIVFSGRVHNDTTNKLWKYNPKSGLYSKIDDLSTEVSDAAESTEIWSIAYTSGKWWAVVVHDEGSIDTYNNLTTFAGDIVVPDAPRCRVLGTYKNRIWLYDWFGDMHWMSLSDKIIKQQESKTLSNAFRLSRLSSTGVTAGANEVQKYKPDAYLVLYVLETAQVTNKFPDILCGIAAVSPSGGNIAVNSSTGSICIYDTSESTPVMQREYKFGNWELSNIEWSEDEKYLVICIQRNGFLQLFPTHETQLGIINLSDGNVTWLSATVASSYTWGVGS